MAGARLGGVSGQRPAGRRAEAQAALLRVVEADEREETAWYWLSTVVDDPQVAFQVAGGYWLTFTGLRRPGTHTVRILIKVGDKVFDESATYVVK